MTTETRGRTPRIEAVQKERRRRSDDTISRSNTMKLDIFTEDQLDADYEYAWVNDLDHGRRINDKYNQDWDVVNADEIKGLGYHQISSDADTDTRVRKAVGTNDDGSPIYTILMKKPKEFVAEDQAKKFAAARAKTSNLIHSHANAGDKSYVKKAVEESSSTKRGSVI